MRQSGKTVVVLKALVVAAMALGSVGCAIHTQGPIKEVAYDFSDRDFYDRSYAPSPQYLQAEADYGLPVASHGGSDQAVSADASAELPASSFVELVDMGADAR